MADMREGKKLEETLSNQLNSLLTISKLLKLILNGAELLLKNKLFN